MAAIDAKVDLKEVQTALNECQSDLAEQLTEFKSKLLDKFKTQEASLVRVMERKVDLNEFRALLDNKSERSDLQQFVTIQELEAIKQQIADVIDITEKKIDRDHFSSFDKAMEEKLQEIIKQLQRKSNIKDVCALLDLKSSK